MLDSIRPHFEEGGKLSRFWVVYDSLETFAFTPGHTTKSGVHIRDGVDLKRTMFMVIVALIPALLFGTWNQGHQYLLSIGEVSVADPLMMAFWDKLLIGAVKVLPLVVVSYGVGLGIEFLFAGMRGHSINEGYLVSGMLIPLIMPVDVPRRGCLALGGGVRCDHRQRGLWGHGDEHSECGPNGPSVPVLRLSETTLGRDLDP